MSAETVAFAEIMKSMQEQNAIMMKSMMDRLEAMQGDKAADEFKEEAPKKDREWDMRNVRGAVPEFAGNHDKWDEFAFKLRTAISSQCPQVADWMNEAEKMPTEIEENGINPEQRKASAKVFAVLAGVCTGEPLEIIKSVPQGHGMRAWQKIVAKFSPKTTARTIKLLAAATRPPKVTKVSEVSRAIDKWEEQVRRIESIGAECILTNTIKIAILTDMLPVVIQDYVYTHVEPDHTYKQVVDKVRVLATNKAEASGPSPMDVGSVAAAAAEWPEEPWYEENVDAVGVNTQCYNCGGWGHLSRDCSSTKGKGKGVNNGHQGGKDAGKGHYGGKGFGKDQGKNGYGGKGAGKTWGKAFTGQCFNCGQTGHRKADCPTIAKPVQEIAENVAEVSIEGVNAWMVGNIQVETFTEVTKKKARRTWKPLGMSEAYNENRYENRFKALQETEAETVIDIMNIFEGKKMTRESFMRFHEADCRKLLASAVKVARAGNRVVMEDDGGFIENKKTGETMLMYIKDETYVYDVQLDDDAIVTVTMDSGAGCSVWPKGLTAGQSKLEPPKPGMRMSAANGTEIKNYGQRCVRFRGIDATGFTRQK